MTKGLINVDEFPAFYQKSTRMKAVLARLVSVKISRCSTYTLAVLLLSNLSLIIGYALWPEKYSLSSSTVVARTSYGVVQPKERKVLSLSVRERNEVRIKKSLVEDMKQCSLAMGMTREELNESMSNLTTVAAKVKKLLNALQSIIPEEYSKEIKNPCWTSNLTASSRLRMAPTQGLQGGAMTLLKFTKGLWKIIGGSSQQMSRGNSQLYCLPYFFIAGYPKSGTTTLHEALQEHPRIVSPTTKEPHWWTRVNLEDMNADYLKLIIMEYIFYFSGVAKKLSQYPSEDVITYDASQCTLWDSNFFMNKEDYCATPALISRILPNAKFIILMRNPITREHSNFFYACGSTPILWPKHIQNDPAGQFHKAVEADTTLFSECLRGNGSLPKCMRQIRMVKSGCGTGHIGQRFPIGLYYVHIHKWLQFYPKENFLFLRTEDMCSEPLQMMTKITNFLGVEAVSKEQASKWLCHEANAQLNIYATDPENFKMRPETKKLLEEFYKPFNLKVAELTGSRRFLWQ